MKYIFVTGGVMSGLGKGVVTSSIAKLLQLAGLNVSCIKIDPYLNYDAGTMNPIAHGEVFVTEDGGECDMDIGNYERFLNQNIPKNHNITTAQVFSDVIRKERDGGYLGDCVQIIPHITDEIRRRITSVGIDESLDVLIVECGGTVGDIESLPFLEALRQMRATCPPGEDVLFIHVTLAPSLDVVGEQKTKPTQHSVQELRRIGIQPDYLAVRCTQPLQDKTKEKLALFTGVDIADVLSCHDAESIFEIPIILYEQVIVDSVFRKFGHTNLMDPENWSSWNNVVDSMTKQGRTVRIAMVGKYVTLTDSYVSVNQALRHAAADLGVSVKIDLLDSEIIRNDIIPRYDGILVPGGFGTRGAEGIIQTARQARLHDIPYLGICFGFQLAAVAFARDALNMHDAHTSEIIPDTDNVVVHLLPDQLSDHATGGSLRLGAHAINIKHDTRASNIYQSDTIRRRHRHRYEINTDVIPRLEGAGMIFSASSDDNRRMEILEIPSCRFYMGVQFHPEFSSRPGFPEASYRAFVDAASRI
ncbi:MAG: CTP synthase [Cenarchaeum sp. SB0662_bin_33]|nr:CTP synthase [Cenarchaeum sp. SB0662_bin_33]